jgi:hypothetical protein
MIDEYWESSPFGKVSFFNPIFDEKQKEERLELQKLIENNKVKSGKIYLTFDDGLQLGTKDVLEVLKLNKVKATFFLTGQHIKYYVEKINKQEGLELLKEIYLNHYLGNHSYSHANDFYENYYNDGLKIGEKKNGDFVFRSILEDFKLNDITINKFLNEAGIQIERNFQHKIARFPGRNTWKTKYIEDVVSDTVDETKNLYSAGYRIYGWDTEWEMNFQVAEISRNKVNQRVNSKKMNWEDEDQTHPFFNLCNSHLVTKDRLIETWTDISNDLEDFAYHSSMQPFDDKSKKNGSVILLMHERAFRQCGTNYKKEANKLSYLIKSLKKKGFSFETINNY